MFESISDPVLHTIDDTATQCYPQTGCCTGLTGRGPVLVSGTPCCPEEPTRALADSSFVLGRLQEVTWPSSFIHWPAQTNSMLWDILSYIYMLRYYIYILYVCHISFLCQCIRVTNRQRYSSHLKKNRSPRYVRVEELQSKSKRGALLMDAAHLCWAWEKRWAMPCSWWGTESFVLSFKGSDHQVTFCSIRTANDRQASWFCWHNASIVVFRARKKPRPRL